ncbi:hypothetical protein KM043_009489 [Ampulex compressa]|nr:hypothetical protein KM043_009489 [Ampulex compressa]
MYKNKVGRVATGLKIPASSSRRCSRVPLEGSELVARLRQLRMKREEKKGEERKERRRTGQRDGATRKRGQQLRRWFRSAARHKLGRAAPNGENGSREAAPGKERKEQQKRQGWRHSGTGAAAEISASREERRDAGSRPIALPPAALY